MKKILMATTVCLFLLVVGCGKKEEEGKKQQRNPQEIAMEEYAKDYYIKFMNKYLTNPTVSLQELKKSKEDGYTDYDLSTFNNCKDSSYVELQLEEGTNEIIGYVHHLDCSK